MLLSQEAGADWLKVAPTGALMTELKGGRGKPLVSSSVIADGVWHGLVSVWDGAYRRLYVDDLEVATEAAMALDGSTGTLQMGAGSTLIPGTFWSYWLRRS